MTKEEAINKLAHIIFDAAKAGYIPFNVDGKLCAMSVARAKINEFLLPLSDTVELHMSNLDDAAKVDLEKEYKDFVEEDPVYNKLVNGIVGKAIAKHFYELGLTQKGK